MSATICIRQKKNGDYTYRVRIRRKGYPLFSASFEDWQRASNWIRENEELFYDDPVQFIKNHKALGKEMRLMGVRVQNGMKRPVEKY